MKSSRGARTTSWPNTWPGSFGKLACRQQRRQQQQLAFQIISVIMSELAARYRRPLSSLVSTPNSNSTLIFHLPPASKKPKRADNNLAKVSSGFPAASEFSRLWRNCFLCAHAQAAGRLARRHVGQLACQPPSTASMSVRLCSLARLLALASRR